MVHLVQAETSVARVADSGMASWPERRSHPCKDVTPLRQQMSLSFDHGHCAMDLPPKDFLGVGSPMNLELAKDSSTGVRIEAVVLYLLANIHHEVSYDWILLVGCSLPFPEQILEKGEVWCSYRLGLGWSKNYLLPRKGRHQARGPGLFPCSVELGGSRSVVLLPMVVDLRLHNFQHNPRPFL